MSNESDLVSIGHVAKITGLSVHTLRQWERRYGYPNSVKLSSGHRRYSQDEIQRLLLVARALDAGYRAHKVVGLNHEDLILLLRQNREVDRTKSYVESWLAATKKMDEDQLAVYFELDWQNLGPIGFLADQLAPFLKYLGDEWSYGNISVAQEHFFSEVVSSFLSNKWRNISRNNIGPAYLVACAEEELHGIGLHMCAAVLSALGCRVVFLGTSTPLEDIKFALAHQKFSGLCLSYSSSYPAVKSQEQVKELLKVIPDSCELIIGGDGAPKNIAGVQVFQELKEFYNSLRYKGTS